MPPSAARRACATPGSARTSCPGRQRTPSIQTARRFGSTIAIAQLSPPPAEPPTPTIDCREEANRILRASEARAQGNTLKQTRCGPNENEVRSWTGSGELSQCGRWVIYSPGANIPPASRPSTPGFIVGNGSLSGIGKSSRRVSRRAFRSPRRRSFRGPDRGLSGRL